MVKWLENGATMTANGTETNAHTHIHTHSILGERTCQTDIFILSYCFYYFVVFHMCVARSLSFFLPSCLSKAISPNCTFFPCSSSGWCLSLYVSYHFSGMRASLFYLYFALFSSPLPLMPLLPTVIVERFRVDVPFFLRSSYYIRFVRFVCALVIFANANCFFLCVPHNAYATHCLSKRKDSSVICCFRE